MDFFRSIAGMAVVELTSADIPGFLAAANEKGIPLHKVDQKDHLTVEAVISRNHYGDIQTLARQKGSEVKLIEKQGIYWGMKSFLKRPLFLCGFLLLLFLICWIPTRVLFIEVEGNIRIPTKLIIEQADSCGISFGASRREVRSEKMKNSLLEAIPELQWAGVNTSGCTAIISVKERSDTSLETEKPGVSSIVAVRDGIVESCTVTKGSALCKAGQAVKAGQTLISGYTDCGISIKATRAEGEIMAQTVHEITVITPLNYIQKGESARTVKKYGLIIGKNRINFYKDSGISGTSCDKMYSEYYVTLPGGFQLPVALVVEQWTIYDNASVSVSADSAQSIAEDYAQAYLLGQMISGQILGSTASAEQADETLVLQGRYLCSEMIGRVQSEEITGSYGKNN